MITVEVLQSHIGSTETGRFAYTSDYSVVSTLELLENWLANNGYLLEYKLEFFMNTVLRATHKDDTILSLSVNYDEHGELVTQPLSDLIEVAV